MKSYTQAQIAYGTELGPHGRRIGRDPRGMTPDELRAIPLAEVPATTMGRDRDRRDRLLTVNQLADFWQVSPRTIRRKIQKKQIPVIRIGRAVRIHPETAELGPDGTV
jgi:excisionase family DNA binding protein